MIDATEPTRAVHETAESTGSGTLLFSVVTYGEVTHTETITVDFPVTYWNNLYSIAAYDIAIDTSQE